MQVSKPSDRTLFINIIFINIIMFRSFSIQSEDCIKFIIVMLFVSETLFRDKYRRSLMVVELQKSSD